ncbi:MAG: sugar phosphate isomerase/epimerase [Phycisphaerae bacterium]|nr:sugar phosphate isomerase/epimerase [Phycisphaerae bacterium]
MLLTLSARGLTPLMRPGAPGALTLNDIPRFARERLGLRGVVIPTSMLTGADRESLTRLREHADKATCPILGLIESERHPFAGSESDVAASVDRVTRVIQAAHWLGCNWAAIGVRGVTDQATLESAADPVRRVLKRAEKFELNLLLMPARADDAHAGLLGDPEKIVELLKRVGGFRIGTLPDFEHAAAHADPQTYVRKLTPYASSVIVGALGFRSPKARAKGKPEFEHDGYDMDALARTVESVGFEGTAAIDYRGKGDLAEGIARTRAALESIWGREDGSEPDPEAEQE